MAAKKKVAAKKSTSKSMVVSWQQQLAKHAKEGKAPKEKPLTGDYISTKNSKFALGGAKLGSEIECVVVGWCFENAYHDYAYVQDEAFPPTCFSIGYDEDDLMGDELSPDRQGGEGFMCNGCEHNEWGSAKVGKGKACSNRRRLALVVDADKGRPEIKMLSIAPTSIDNWKKFVEDLENLNIHTMQAVVSIHFDEDSTAAQAPLVFDFVKEITAEKTLQALASTLDIATKMLDKPNDVSSYVGGGKKVKSKKKAAKKKAAKKKSKFSK